jgi:AhpD family alkylhydroperoxidase
MAMPDTPKRFFNSDTNYVDYYKESHAPGALDVKTKELMHLAVVLALHCEPWAVSHFAGAKKLGATDAEIEETVQLAGSVGAGVILAMADRARDASEAKHFWWRPPRMAGR